MVQNIDTEIDRDRHRPKFSDRLLSIARSRRPVLLSQYTQLDCLGKSASNEYGRL